MRKFSRRSLSFLLAVCILVPAFLTNIPSTQAATPVPFQDVSASSWYYDSIVYAYENNLMFGTSQTTFAPDAIASRAMLVTILHRMAGSPQVSGENTFQDVQAGRWYTQAVSWAAQAGIVNGYSTVCFAPDDPVTRQQMAAIFYRYAQYTSLDTDSTADLSIFPDYSTVNDWAESALSWCVASGLITGAEQNGQILLAPHGSATRAQVAAILQRFYEKDAVAPALTVGYIPLDNRPVNNLRPVYQIESAGMRVLMPEEDLYATRLDNQSANSNGTTYGDRQALLDWLKGNEAQCDIIVVSLDQLLSGGLVSSRVMNHEDLQFEYEAIDYLAQLAARKPVYVFDTVMRLASTVNYQGLGSEEYTAFRNYGRNARPCLTGDNLTIDNIYHSYRYDANGEPIATTLSEEALAAYHAARARKLRLTDRMLQQSQNLACFYIGIDDSCPENSIQTNEIAYLQQHLGGNTSLFCGTDELGMMAVSRAYSDQFQYQPTLHIRYFGAHEDDYADSFDTATLRQSVEWHVEALGATVSAQNADAQVLILTRQCSQEAADEFVAAWKENNDSGIATIVIDASNSVLAYSGILDSMPVTYLLGYSCWGTSANAIGIALSMGLTRLTYLQYQAAPQAAHTQQFARELIFAFIKDIAYCSGCRYTIQDLSPTGIAQHLCGYTTTQTLLATFPQRQLAMTLDDKNPVFYTIPTIRLTDFSAPFARSYEISFQICLD